MPEQFIVLRRDFAVQQVFRSPGPVFHRHLARSRLGRVFNGQHIQLVNVVVVCRICEGQRQNAEVDQVGFVDPGKLFASTALMPRYIGAMAACSRELPWP